MLIRKSKKGGISVKVKKIISFLALSLVYAFSACVTIKAEGAYIVDDYYYTAEESFKVV